MNQEQMASYRERAASAIKKEWFGGESVDWTGASAPCCCDGGGGGGGGNSECCCK